MKELSIEQKAKAYDEALKVLHKYDGANIMFTQDLKEEMFPELKESDKSKDERIRKALIRYFTLSDEHAYNEACGVSYRDIVAWLEKQGNANKEYWRGYREGKQEILDKYTELGKQGEQKPNYCHHEVDLSGCSEEYRKAYYDGWNNCNMQHSQRKSELDDVVKCLINGMKFYYEDNEEATWGTDKWSMPVKHIIEVLEKYGSQNLANSCKTCKDEQKPAEWSGDDEKMIRALVSMCDVWATSHQFYPKENKEMEALKTWLYSLKERYTWKPSDEQIEALESATVNCAYSEYQDCLRELIGQLKELMEE